MSKKYERLSLPQPVRLICPDDVVRDPASGRLVRIVYHVEQDAKRAYFRAVDLKTGSLVDLALSRSARFVVYLM